MNSIKVAKLRALLIDKYVELIDIPDDLLLLSLTKRGFTENLKYGSGDYNRLEFLGDAVLDLIVGDLLFHDFSINTAGELTQIRSNIVKNISLSCLAEHKNLCGLIIPRYEYEKDCADLFESLIGTIYYYLKPLHENPLAFILYWLIEEFNFVSIVYYLILHPEQRDVCSATKLELSTIRPAKDTTLYNTLYKEEIEKREINKLKQEIETLVENEKLALSTLYKQKKEQYGIDKLEEIVNAKLAKEMTNLEKLTSNELLLQQIAIQKQLAKEKIQSTKTLLDNFYMKYKLDRPVKYIRHSKDNLIHTYILCPKNIKCNDYYIGLGVDSTKNKSEEIAAEQALLYLNYLK